MAKQGDEEVLEKLLLHLRGKFPRLKFGYKVPLRDLFAEPEKNYLRSIWKHGHGDVPVYRHGELVCIVEIGGSNHFKDKRQRDRDKRKDVLCKVNEVSCLRVANSFVNLLGKKVTEELLRKYFYSLV